MPNMNHIIYRVLVSKVAKQARNQRINILEIEVKKKTETIRIKVNKIMCSVYQRLDNS